MKRNAGIVMLFAALIFAEAVQSVSGQTPPQQPTQPPAEQQQQQSNLGGDPIRQLNLSPEQREQIRAIREDNRTERAEITVRVREANRLLDEALNADSPDEAVVEQRLREVSAAQAAATRMRILTEVKIRRVLTREQRVVLKNLQAQAQQNRRQRIREERQEQRRQILDGARTLQNNRNDAERLLRQRQLRRRQRP